jgi:hypothetical protein
MFTLEFSKRQLELMVRLWKFISSTCLVSLYETTLWSENFIQDHPNCTFDELEQTFCKHFLTVKNDEKIYMQLKNL